MSKLASLQQSLGVSFKNTALLEQALVHSSYINENAALKLNSNERLEFLGDAVLGLVIAEKLYQDSPQSTEGALTRSRASVVQRNFLANVAQTIELGDYLLLGKGEEAGGGRNKPVNLAGALEAVIAAVYLDRGLDSAREFILRLFSAEEGRLAHEASEKDYKSQLQELAQARHQKTPAYRVIEVKGPDHNRTFTVEVRVGNIVLGRGSGRSKKIAEAEAACSALEALPPSFTE